LLAWYDRHRRDLPWRRSRDAWAIWVSEVMLQQTRVETVLPYFERFLARFPTPEALASAPLEEALALWSGLGYYRRARSLHRAAGEVVARGGIPRTAAELAGLPGIGPYTAAAIASIAFDESCPVLDGNVVRVVARRLAEDGDPARAATRRRLLAAAAELLDPARPGDANQALMELGATLCRPRAPGCPACPLAAGCRAAAQESPEAYPRPRERAVPRRVRQIAAWVEAGDGRLLIVRRSGEARLLPGLWELPTVEARGPRGAERALGASYGGVWRVGRRRAKLRHSITSHAIELEVRSADWSAPPELSEASGHEFVAPEEAARRALTGAARRILADA